MYPASRILINKYQLFSLQVLQVIDAAVLFAMMIPRNFVPAFSSDAKASGVRSIPFFSSI